MTRLIRFQAANHGFGFFRKAAVVIAKILRLHGGNIVPMKGTLLGDRSSLAVHFITHAPTLP